MTLIPSSSPRECFVVVLVTSSPSYDEPSATATARAYPRWARVGGRAARRRGRDRTRAARRSSTLVRAAIRRVTPPVLWQRASRSASRLRRTRAWVIARRFAATGHACARRISSSSATVSASRSRCAVDRARARVERAAAVAGLRARAALGPHAPVRARAARSLADRARARSRGRRRRDARRSTARSRDWSSARAEIAPADRCAGALLKFPGFALLPAALALQRAPAHRVRRALRRVLPARASARGSRTLRDVLGHDDGVPAAVGRGLARARRGRVLRDRTRRARSRRAGAARGGARCCGIAYYAGVPLLLAAPLPPLTPTHGVAGLKTESAQPMRSWPKRFQTGFLPPTICASV